MSSKEVPETAASSSESDADLSSNSVIMSTVYCLKMYEIDLNSKIHRNSRVLRTWYFCFELFWSKGAEIQIFKTGYSPTFSVHRKHNSTRMWADSVSALRPQGKETERLIYVNKTYINLTQPSIGGHFWDSSRQHEKKIWFCFSASFIFIWRWD